VDEKVEQEAEQEVLKQLISTLNFMPKNAIVPVDLEVDSEVDSR